MRIDGVSDLFVTHDEDHFSLFASSRRRTSVFTYIRDAAGAANKGLSFGLYLHLYLHCYVLGARWGAEPR